jgi:hypothetical protein
VNDIAQGIVVPLQRYVPRRSHGHWVRYANSSRHRQNFSNKAHYSNPPSAQRMMVQPPIQDMLNGSTVATTNQDLLIGRKARFQYPLIRRRAGGSEEGGMQVFFSYASVAFGNVVAAKWALGIACCACMYIVIMRRTLCMYVPI